MYLKLLQPLLDVLEEQTNLMEEENSDPNALCRRSPNFILIVNKFILPNFKNLMWVFLSSLDN